MKKIFVWFFMCIFVISTVLMGAGCKKAEEVVPAEETAEAEAPAEEEAPEEVTEEAKAEGIPIPENKVTVDCWWQDWSGGQLWLKDFKKVFEEKYPTIDINIMFIPFEELQSKLIPSISSGTEPPVMYGYVDWLANIDTSGLFAKLSPEVFTKEEWAEKIYDPVLKSVYSSDGEIYVAPWGCGGSGWGIVYHEDLLEEAGIDPDSLNTWDGIKNAAKELTEYNDDGSIKRSGLLINFAEISITYLDLIMSQGAGDRLYNEEEGIWDFTIPESKNAMELLKSFVDDKVFDPEAGDVMTAFPNKLGAMVGIGPWAAGMFQSSFPELKVMPTPWPAYPGGELSHINPQWGAIMVSKNVVGDEKNAALIFVKEIIENPAFFDIPFENGYWFGVPGNKAYLDILKERIDEGTAHPNAVIAYNNSVGGLPGIDGDFMPRVVLAEIERTIIWPEIEKVFRGTQSIDDMMDYLTDYMTRLEQEKM